MSFGITPETATDIAVIYRDIQAAEELLADVHKALDRYEQVDIRDVFGRRRHSLELGIPSGDSSRRILHVPYALAVPVIQATIAEHRAKLLALNIKARAELAQGIEAATAGETREAGLDPTDESPVGAADAPEHTPI